MDFKEACQIINDTYVLTQREKSDFIKKAKEGNKTLLGILEKFKQSQDVHTFYEDLQKHKMLSTSSMYNVKPKILDFDFYGILVKSNPN